MPMNERTEGERAGDIMGAGVVSEFHTRISASEKRIVELQEQLQNSRQTGDIPYPGFVEHVAHVMGKHFFHDKPDGFDAKYSPRSASERAAG